MNLQLYVLFRGRARWVHVIGDEGNLELISEIGLFFLFVHSPSHQMDTTSLPLLHIKSARGGGGGGGGG